MKKSVRKLISLGLAAAFSVIGMLSVSATEYVEKVVAEDFTTASACEFIAPGDLNADGSVNADDSVSLRKLLLSNLEDKSYDAVYASKGAEAKYSDINGDKNVDIKDLVRQKKNLTENFVFIEDGAMSLNGNSAYIGEFISVLGSGAEYEISYTYKSDSSIKVMINGLSEEIVYENEAASDSTTVTNTFKTPLTLAEANGIELQIIGVGLVENISVTRINMDNDLVENW